MRIIALMLIVFSCLSCAPKPPAPGLPGNPVEQLEKELAQEKKAAAEANAKVEAKEKELSEARVISRQKKLWWVSGICVIALLGCIAGAIFLPGAARYFVSGALASAAVGVAAYFLAWLMPYLPWVVAGFAVLVVAAIVWLWRRDHMGLRRVVQGFESLKGGIPDYKSKMRRFVDGADDKYVNTVRQKLGLKRKEEKGQ